MAVSQHHKLNALKTVMCAVAGGHSVPVMWSSAAYNMKPTPRILMYFSAACRQRFVVCDIQAAVRSMQLSHADDTVNWMDNFLTPGVLQCIQAVTMMMYKNQYKMAVSTTVHRSAIARRFQQAPRSVQPPSLNDFFWKHVITGSSECLRACFIDCVQKDLINQSHRFGMGIKWL
jgi:hypothetical protein